MPKYFKAAGRSLELWLQWKQQREEGTRRWWDLCVELGFDSIFSTDGELLGFGYKTRIPGPGDLPTGWRYDRRQGAILPALRTPEGKAHKKRLRALARVTEQQLAMDVCGVSSPLYSVPDRIHRFLKIGVETLDDGTVILGFHDDMPHQPLDAIPLKRSEYWALKGD